MLRLRGKREDSKLYSNAPKWRSGRYSFCMQKKKASIDLFQSQKKELPLKRFTFATEVIVHEHDSHFQAPPIYWIFGMKEVKMLCTVIQDSLSLLSRCLCPQMLLMMQVLCKREEQRIFRDKAMIEITSD